jgi:hypothetical protein
MIRTRVLLIGLCATAAAALAQSPVTVTVDVRAAGATIPPEFLGLSFESSNLLPHENGGRIFSASNRALIDLLRTLGIRSLRIGGGTADIPRYAMPADADIDSLFAFAAAADVKVIYTLRLPRTDAVRDAQIARYIQQHYGERLTCFEIGNEPDFYRRVYREIPDYATYRPLWEKIADAVIKAAPEAKFCGPAAGGTTAWSRSFIADFGKTGRIAAIVEHDYPGGDGNKISGAPARDEMLSRAWMEHYDQFYQSFAAPAVARGLKYRLEETNNFTGGAKDATDTFTASLWVLDYLHWWAARGAAGMNFHNRRWILNTTIFPIDANDDGIQSGYDVHPIAYGIKAFDAGGHGAVVPVAVADPEAVNLTAYAVRDGSSVFVTVINKKDPGDEPHDALVTIAAPGGFSRAEAMALAAEGGAAARNGITLGGSAIGSGRWDGKWSAVPMDPAGHCAVKMAGTSAVVVKATLR